MTNNLQITNHEAAAKMDRGASQLVMQQPFFAALYMRLVRRERLDVETMRVDGVSLDYNPDFVLGLTMPQLVGVLAHEVSHLAALHHTRRGHRDLATWQKAADYSINPIVMAAGLELPAGCLIDPQYDGLSAEEIYAQLVKQQQDDQGQDQAKDSQSAAGAGAAHGQDQAQGQAPGQGSGGTDPAGCGEVADAPVPAGEMQQTQANLDEQEAEWRVAVIQAQQAARAAGKMPGALSEAIDQVKRPKVDWRDQLRRFFTANDRTDYSWTPPNRRFASQNLYLPSLRSEEMGEMVLAIDTSASVTKAELDAFAAEFRSIMEEVRPRLIHIVYCDAMVQLVEQFTRDDVDIRLQAPGRGGTRFVPVFKWVEENHISPSCLVYLTDLECNEFPQEPDYPTLWVSTNRPHAPFGEVIKLLL